MADAILLRFPATPPYVRLARLAATDAGSRAGLDVEEIDDLRMAVSELCALVGREDGTTSLEFRVSPSRVEVEGTGGAAEVSESAAFAEALVVAVTDEYELDRDGDAATFRIVKDARASTPAGA